MATMQPTLAQAEPIICQALKAGLWHLAFASNVLRGQLPEEKLPHFRVQDLGGDKESAKLSMLQASRSNTAHAHQAAYSRLSM